MAKLRKAQGHLYSVVLMSYVKESDGQKADAPSIDKILAVNTISKVINVIEHLGQMEGFTTPSLERMRANICNAMPKFSYQADSNSGITYEIHVKQHAVGIGVVINADINDDVDITECPPF